MAGASGQGAAFREAEGHPNSRSSCSMVGRSSVTVGWMCIARAITLQGALAYIWSSAVWTTSSPQALSRKSIEGPVFQPIFR